MTLTDLQRQRLDAAVAALREAGAEKLPGRLLEEYQSGPDERGTYARQSAALHQARAWAAIGVGNDPAKAAARDAVGLLWAVVEDGV